MTRLDVAAQQPQFHVAIRERRQPPAEQALRDIAYVLHLTQRVKAEILAERAEREAWRMPPVTALAL